MLYSLTPPGPPVAGVRLFPSPDRAREHASDGRAVVAVAVHFEGWAHAVVPDRPDAGPDGRIWAAPAEQLADGSVAVRGPIPAGLFVPARPGGGAVAGARRELEIRNPDGLHLRLAAKLAEAAGRFFSDVRVGNGRSEVDGKSALELLTLAAASGTRLVVEASGADAVEAVEALAALVASWAPGGAPGPADPGFSRPRG